MKLAKIKSVIGKSALALGAVGLTTQMAMAQVNVGSVAAIPIANTDLLSLIGRLVNYVLLFTGIIAVVYLIWGGITYITAGGDAEKAGKGRTAITNAIIGIIIIVASFAIYTAVIRTANNSNVPQQGNNATFG